MEWMKLAHEEMGVEEVGGKRSHPRIMQYFREVGASWAKDDATPWCGAFVGFLMQECGYSLPSQPLRARDWEFWGTETTARKGAVVVFPRGKNPSQGHVGLVERVDGEWLYVLGGNQNDSVSIAKFRRDKAITFRWPEEAAAPLPAPVAAAKSSKTITGVLVAMLGTVVAYLEAGFQLAMEAAGKVADWAPVESLAFTLGANGKTLGFVMAVSGLGLALYRRLDAAQQGKEG